MQPLYLDQLINDHTLIEKALIILERQVDRGDKLNTNMTKALIDFLWAYGDEYHNMKEEKIYFPLLLRKGMPEQGPIPVMLQEHKSEREYLTEIKRMLEEKETSGNLSNDFKKVVLDYLDLTKNHIWKENDILYPMGKKFLSADDEVYLITEFKKFEKDTIGEGSVQRYTTMLNTFEKESGGKVDLLASLSTEVITNMIDALPIELSFVDHEDRVRYYSKVDKEKIFTRTLSVIGRTVQQCHPQKSVHLVNQIINEMKEGKREKATFWIKMGNKYVHISYFAVRDKDGNYQGCVEMVHDIQPYRELEGEKRLLDEE